MQETDDRAIPVMLAPSIHLAVESYDYVRQREYMCSLERERANLWGVNEELRLKIASLEAGTLDLQEMLNALRSPLEVKAPDDERQMLLPILGKCRHCLRSLPYHGTYKRPSTINPGRYENVRCPDDKS